MIVQAQQIITNSLQRISRGNDICNILAASINGVDAGEAIRKHVIYKHNHIAISSKNFDLNKYKHIYLLGAGKACIPMAIAISKILNNQITAGLLITKDKYLDPLKIQIEPNIRIIEAGHPIPDQRNLNAAIKLINLTSKLNQDDLVILLLSGGGSSLLMYPSSGITLYDIQVTTDILLRCGASITEINTIRKHLDQFKGGGLVRFLIPATIISFILSDVVGDNLEVIASGPTVADPTTYSDVSSIFDKYQILDKISPNIRAYISAGLLGNNQETIKPGDPILSGVTNVIVGNNVDAIKCAHDAAQKYGFCTELITNSLQGEASEMGIFLLSEAITRLSSQSFLTRPSCFIAGGETTVTIKGSGIGGRNQEITLSVVKSLSGLDQWIFSSLATDGGDGPTDAAGAIATNETYIRGISMGLDPADYLKNNDSYHYFDALGDLIKTGPTSTNVNDLVFIFAL